MPGVTPDYTLSSLTQPSGPPPGARRRTGLIVGLVIGGVVLLAAAAIGASLVLQAGKMTVTGTLTIPARSAGGVDGDACSGHDDLNDIDQGTEVQITDAGSATIALTALHAGRLVGGGCVFAWTANNVPTGKKFYGIVVGRRPGTKVPEAQMHQPIALSMA
jgi:hypothetical protein